MPKLMFRYYGATRPSHIQLARARRGIAGVRVHSSTAQWAHAQAVRSERPTPAQGGRGVSPCSCGSSPSLTGVSAPPAAGALRVGTRRVCRSRLICGSAGCCTEDACDSSTGRRSPRAVQSKGPRPSGEPYSSARPRRERGRILHMDSSPSHSTILSMSRWRLAPRRGRQGNASPPNLSRRR